MPKSCQIRRGERGTSDTHIDAALRQWTTPRLGVCTRLGLTKGLGLSHDQVDRRLASGRLTRTEHAGVFVWGHGAHVRGQREAIRLAACGPGAVLTGSAMAWLRKQIGSYQGDVDVLVRPGRHTKAPGIRKHRAVLRPEDVTTFGALRVASPERTAFDLPPEHIREAFQWLMRRGTPIEAIVDRARGRRGAVLRHHASLLVPQLACTSSELEARFVLLCDRIGADAPTVNGALESGDLLDCTWPDKRLVVELDGRRWHESHFDADRARDRRRTLEGKLPMRFGWHDVVADADRTGREVLQGLSLG